MTTERQKTANTANAKKSTGPKSSAGRNRSSKNARKHGPTAPPLWEDVTRWFQVILDDPDATPDPTAREDRLRAAFRLAEAEAQLERCQETERTHLTHMFEQAGGGSGHSLRGAANRAAKNPSGIDALKLRLEWLDDPRFIDATKTLIRIHPDRPAALNKTMQNFRRHRREAEGRRRKALVAWVSHAGQNSEKYETNPITISG